MPAVSARVFASGVASACWMVAVSFCTTSGGVPAGAKIATTASVPPGLKGKPLRGKLVLEVPRQTTAVPTAVLQKAKDLEITIRDTTGKVYSLDVKTRIAPPTATAAHVARATVGADAPQGQAQATAQQKAADAKDARAAQTKARGDVAPVGKK